MDDIITSAHPACPACGSAGLPAQTGVMDPDGNIPGTWSFRKCPGCGLVWLDPAPLESELWKAYTRYHTHTREASGKAAKALLSLANRLSRMLLSPAWMLNGLWRETDYLRYMTLKNVMPGKLLDVGCGGGRFMRRMARMEWDVEGIDFDEKATAKITRRYGMKTYTGDLLSSNLADASYDAITMSHTIEHLPHPERTLMECMRILRPGGRLVITTPNVEGHAAALFGPCWRGWEPPRHLRLFSVGTLKTLLTAAGFGIDEIRSSSAGAAGVYRTSRMMQQGGAASLFFRLGLIFWSYGRELEEFSAQKNGEHAGQNLLACARKPLQHTP